jgi:hypothetical protein
MNHGEYPFLRISKKTHPIGILMMHLGNFINIIPIEENCVI